MNPAEQHATTVLASHDQTPGLLRVHAVVMSLIAGISATIAVSGFLAASDYRPDNTGNASAAVDVFIGNLHAHSVEWLVAVVLVYLGVALLDPQVRVPQRTVRVMLGLYTLVLTASWCGSILSWDDRAKQAFGIGTHVFDSYVPVAGAVISNYLWQSNRFREPSLMRVFLLHAVVLAPAVLLVVRAVRRNAVRSLATTVTFAAGVVVPFCSALFLAGASPDVPTVASSVAIQAQQAVPPVHPAWYLGVPYELLKSLPEDFVVALFGIAIIIVFVYGAGTGLSVSQRIGQWSARILYAVYVAFQIQIFIAWHVR
jgi:quinol-cytochrome oxidoreductase complex cytochrome b subunit